MSDRLYRVNSDRQPEAFWAVPIDAEDGLGGFALRIYRLDGQEIPWNRSPIDLMKCVGDFSSQAELQELMLPYWISHAILRLQEVLEGQFSRTRAAERALHRTPAINAIWILRATPEELHSWAATLAE